MVHRIAAHLRANMTAAEQLLWSRLRRRQIGGVRFRRQVPLGAFIVDFACFAARLIVEIDGGQHALAAARERDAARDAWLAGQGFRVLRFWNHEVLGNLDGVLAVIDAAVCERLSPPPAPCHKGRG